MTLTGTQKHVGVSGAGGGSSSTEKVGRVRTCKLGLAPTGGRGGTDPEGTVSSGTHDVRRELDKVVDATETEGEGRWTQEEK